MAPVAATVSWSRLLSPHRLSGAPDAPDAPRTPFQRDYDRIVYAPAFRRLADKTQVFPMPPDDHVHSRLTHSLEVATVGRSLGTLVGKRLVQRVGPLPDGIEPRDLGDVVAAACLAHDLGNPPFGHAGEEAIREFFARHRDTTWFGSLTEPEQRDLLHFEGNAQAFRLATRVARPAAPQGLDLTCATLAALVKYPCASSEAYQGARPAGRSTRKHGVNRAEVAIFEQVARATGLARRRPERDAWLRHPLAFLTEAADDVAYTLIDFEDGLRLGHVDRGTFTELLAPLASGEASAPAGGPPAGREELLDWASRLRSAAMNRLLHEAAEVFVEHHGAMLEGRFDDALVSRIPSRERLEAIQEEDRSRCYQARDVLKMEISGAVAIQGVLGALVDAATGDASLESRHFRALLPGILAGGDLYSRLMRITDHVSGMTDNYVVRLYREISGIRLPGGRD